MWEASGPQRLPSPRQQRSLYWWREENADLWEDGVNARKLSLALQIIAESTFIQLWDSATVKCEDGVSAGVSRSRALPGILTKLHVVLDICYIRWVLCFSQIGWPGKLSKREINTLCSLWYLRLLKSEQKAEYHKQEKLNDACVLWEWRRKKNAWHRSSPALTVKSYFSSSLSYPWFISLFFILFPTETNYFLKFYPFLFFYISPPNHIYVFFSLYICCLGIISDSFPVTLV